MSLDSDKSCSCLSQIFGLLIYSDLQGENFQLQLPDSILCEI